MHKLIDVQRWGEGLSADLPAGPNLEDAPEFAALEAAVLGVPEQQYGDVVIPAQSSDWGQIQSLCEELSGRTLDLRVLLLQVRALTQVHGLDALEQGVQALDAVLRCQWDAVHPQLIVDGADDPYIRYNALSGFGDVDGIVADVRQLVVSESSLGTILARDLERLVERGSIMLNGVSVGRDQIEPIVQADRMASAAAITAAAIQARLIALWQMLSERLGPELTPDCSALLKVLDGIGALILPSDAQVLAEKLGQPDTANSAVGETVAAEQHHVLGNAVKTRTEAMQAMEAICEYLERSEPTNPAPLLIRRARRLMGMNFVDIVRELSPDGVNQVLFVAGADDGTG